MFMFLTTSCLTRNGVLNQNAIHKKEKPLKNCYSFGLKVTVIAIWYKIYPVPLSWVSHSFILASYERYSKLASKCSYPYHG